MPILPDHHYPSVSSEMGEVAKPQTLAKWRHEGKGPAYIKSGRLVIYRGSDVLDWLASRRVETNRGR